MADELIIETAPTDAAKAAATDAAKVAAEAQRVADAVKKAEAASEAEMKAASEKAAADKAALGNTGDSELVSRLVQSRLDVELASIKSNLDKAYAQRDEFRSKLAAAEAKDKADKLARLTEEGKFKEAYELQLSEERAANAELARRNTELTRDVSVRESLRSLQFRNDKAAQMAFQEITSNLVQNDKKQWVHRSGISVKEYCESFANDEDQQFLFKAKVNSGGGTSATGNGSPVVSAKPKSIFDMSQAEVLQMAAAGKLDKPRK